MQKFKGANTANQNNRKDYYLVILKVKIDLQVEVLKIKQKD